LNTTLINQIKDKQVKYLSDAPLVDQPKSQDVKKVLKIMRNKFEAQEDYFPILPSKSPAFLTLVA